eukprot:gnl/MRDRNA2_/MRDRNA2_43163_c0_seq1.p1 gnl/MRDRNA2_/MRDRNA2_43163_c0~~gnl/MRDRNA2_/MRDRNA2_43163_c0_seq1.p1  ORF type:complete len:269 (+),score=53.01 gnl/MRDRNA2_/MRDRNA2_43163_c0_seq1:95-808(+)
MAKATKEPIEVLIDREPGEEDDPFADVRSEMICEKGQIPAMKHTEPGLRVTTIDVPADMTKERGFACFLQQVQHADGVIVFRPDGEAGVWESQAHTDKEICYQEMWNLLCHRRQYVDVICVCTGKIRGVSMILPAVSTICLATPDCTFGFPEVKVGGMPGFSVKMLENRCNRTVTNRLTTFGDIIDAEEAQRTGLVDYVGDVETELARLLWQRGSEKEAVFMYKPDLDKAKFEADEE